MDWGLVLCLSPVIIFPVIGLFGLVWDSVLNPRIANYRSFNGPNRHWRGNGAVVKLTYKQWCDFAAIKPEAFCVDEGYLYEVSNTGVANYTKIHFNLIDYLKFVFMYNRVQRYRKKKAAKSKETQDMSAFIHRMQDNIKEYRNKIDAECTVAKEKLSNVAENMLKKNKECYSLDKKLLCYKGTYPSTPFIRRVGDLYMSKDGKKMYVIDKDLNTQTWEADKLLAYISKEGMDAEEAFDFVTSNVVKIEPKKYRYRGDGLTDKIPQMSIGDIYYNPVIKKYMVMEETGIMSYLTTKEFVDKVGGANVCLSA